MSVVASIRSQLVPINREGLSLRRRLRAGKPDPVLDLDAARLDRDAADALVRLFLPRSAAGDAGARRPRGRARRRPCQQDHQCGAAGELDLGDRPLPRVSIFMSVFDCHVNRSPVSGRIEKIVYKTGTFINADLDKASEDNERNSFIIATGGGAHRRGADRRPDRAAHRLLQRARARASRPASASA